MPAIHHKCGKPENFRFALELMSQADREEMFWRYWDELDSFAQRDLAKHIPTPARIILTAGLRLKTVCFFTLAAPLRKSGQALEALGYIHDPNVVEFLMQEMRRNNESLRLAAAGALKKQDPVLVIEPMLDALNKPENFLASRIYDVLQALQNDTLAADRGAKSIDWPPAQYRFDFAAFAAVDTFYF